MDNDPCVTLGDLSTHSTCSCVAPPHLQTKDQTLSSLFHNISLVYHFQCKPLSSYSKRVIHATDVGKLMPWECVGAVTVGQQSRQMLRAPAGKGEREGGGGEQIGEHSEAEEWRERIVYASSSK